MKQIVDDLEAEQESLMEVVRDLPDEKWLTPTPAAGWDVRDQIAHLADTDDIAVSSLIGGERSLMEEAGFYAEKYGDTDGFTRHQVEKGRTKEPKEVLAWWEDAAVRLRAALLEKDPKERVPWGPNMISAMSFATARVMETWAHGLDVRAAVGAPAADTERLRHVVFIVYRAFPHAFRMAGREMPVGEVRVELTAPDGSMWSFGPEGAGERITGTAGEFCRVGVQRMKLSDAVTLRADGALAQGCLEVARAFL